MRIGTFELLTAELARIIEPSHDWLHPANVVDFLSELGLRFNSFPSTSVQARSSEGVSSAKSRPCESPCEFRATRKVHTVCG